MTQGTTTSKMPDILQLFPNINNMANMQMLKAFNSSLKTNLVNVPADGTEFRNIICTAAGATGFAIDRQPCLVCPWSRINDSNRSIPCINSLRFHPPEVTHSGYLLSICSRIVLYTWKALPKISDSEKFLLKLMDSSYDTLTKINLANEYSKLSELEYFIMSHGILFILSNNGIRPTRFCTTKMLVELLILAHKKSHAMQ